MEKSLLLLLSATGRKKTFFIIISCFRMMTGFSIKLCKQNPVIIWEWLTVIKTLFYESCLQLKVLFGKCHAIVDVLSLISNFQLSMFAVLSKSRVINSLKSFNKVKVELRSELSCHDVFNINKIIDRSVFILFLL